MAFLANKVRSARDRQKQALIAEAGKAGAQVVEITEFGDLSDGADAVLGGSIKAFVGGKLRVDGVMVLRLQTNGWPHAFVQPFSGYSPLPGEHHTIMQGCLAAPAILRNDLRYTDHPWDPAAGPEVAQQLTLAPALRQVVKTIAWDWTIGLTKVTIDWAIQLRSVGDGSSHVVMQTGRYGGLTTYEVGFGQWMQVCGALHSCLSAWAPPAQRFPVPAHYADAVGLPEPHAAQSFAAGPPQPAHSPSPIHVAIDYGATVQAALVAHVGKRVWLGAESIPAKKLANLREHVLAPQLANSPILAAIDLTVFGSAKDAIVVTPTQLVSKQYDDRLQIDLAAIRSVPAGQSTISTTVSVVVDRLGTMQLPTATDGAPILALLAAVALANTNANAGQAHSQVSAFVGHAEGQLSPEAAQALAAQAQSAMQTGPVDDKINAAARLLVGGEHQAAIDAYLAIAQAHPEHTGTCYSQVGAGLFFLHLYGRAIEYYEAAKHYGADPRMMDENIAEARSFL